MVRLFFICLFLTAIFPFQVMACSCPADSFTDEASQKNIKKSALIFEGRTLNISNPMEKSNFSEIDIVIEKIFKGSEVNKQIMVYADTETSCGILPLPLKKQKFFMLYKVSNRYVLASGCGAYISDTDMKALKKGDYLYHPPQKLAFPENFKNRKDLDRWAKKTTIAGGQVKDLQFKGMVVLMISRKFSSKEIISDLSLYTMQKSGEYKLSGSYPYVVYDEIEAKQTPEILSFVTKNNDNILLEMAASDILGKSCAQKSDCNDKQHCLKNDYFDVKGICMPCPDVDGQYMPAQCK